ncbi:MAG: regulator, partial [Dolichospermum sp.]|nr:regulator [Dolichospermum sp.]
MFEILVIDDDRSIQMFLKRMLEKQGYEVITASTGEEGILRTLDS